MKSRTFQSGPEHIPDLASALAMEFEERLAGYYLPWIREAVKTLDDTDIWKRPGNGINSIGNLLVHLEGNVRQWILHGLDGQEDTRNRELEFRRNEGKSANELLEDLEQTVHDACNVVNDIKAADILLSRKMIQGFQTTVFDAIFHVAEHFSYHTGQIVMLAKIRTGKDFLFYHL